jgi:DnaJ like chaperone protein
MLILCWIAASDDHIHEDELSGLMEASFANDFQHLDRLLEIAKADNLAAISQAVRVLKLAPKPKHRLILELACALALADNRLTGMEGHILRLLADVFSVSPSALDNLFRELTGKPLPPSSDPSSKAWWIQRERQQSNSRQSRSSSQSETSPRYIERIKDLAFLGLEEDASEHDIRSAYLRMCKVHHPDRYSSLGEEAVAAAEIAFMRVKSAYERLSRS